MFGHEHWNERKRDLETGHFMTPIALHHREHGKRKGGRGRAWNTMYWIEDDDDRIKSNLTWIDMMMAGMRKVMMRYFDDDMPGKVCHSERITSLLSSKSLSSPSSSSFPFFLWFTRVIKCQPDDQVSSCLLVRN